MRDEPKKHEFDSFAGPTESRAMADTMKGGTLGFLLLLVVVFVIVGVLSWIF